MDGSWKMEWATALARWPTSEGQDARARRELALDDNSARDNEDDAAHEW